MRYVPTALAALLAAATPALALRSDISPETKAPQDASDQLQKKPVLPPVLPPPARTVRAQRVRAVRDMGADRDFSASDDADPRALRRRRPTRADVVDAAALPFIDGGPKVTDARKVRGHRNVRVEQTRNAGDADPRALLRRRPTRADVVDAAALPFDDGGPTVTDVRKVRGHRNVRVEPTRGAGDAGALPFYGPQLPGFTIGRDAGDGQQKGADEPQQVRAQRLARQQLDAALLDLAEEIDRESFDIEDLEVVGHMISQWAFTHQPDFPRMCTLRQRLLDEVENLAERARNAYLTKADLKELETHIWDVDIERLSRQLEWRIRERGGSPKLYQELLEAIEQRITAAHGIDPLAKKYGDALQSAVDDLVATASAEVAKWQKLAYQVLEMKIQYALSELEAHAAAFGATRSDYERLQQLWIDRARLDAGQFLPDCE